LHEISTISAQSDACFIGRLAMYALPGMTTPTDDG
jgi:hypothetical protein